MAILYGIGVSEQDNQVLLLGLNILKMVLGLLILQWRVVSHLLFFNIKIILSVLLSIPTHLPKQVHGKKQFTMVRFLRMQHLRGIGNLNFLRTECILDWIKGELQHLFLMEIFVLKFGIVILEKQENRII